MSWPGGLGTTYRVGVDQRAREDITAATAAHRELGPGYDDAVAEGLVERIGAEIDKRVDARLAERGERPVRRDHGGQASPGVRPSAVVLGLGSMTIGGITAVGLLNTHDGNSSLLVALIWIIIGVINVTYARRR